MVTSADSTKETFVKTGGEKIMTKNGSCIGVWL